MKLSHSSLCFSLTIPAFSPLREYSFRAIHSPSSMPGAGPSCPFCAHATSRARPRIVDDEYTAVGSLAAPSPDYLCQFAQALLISFAG